MNWKEMCFFGSFFLHHECHFLLYYMCFLSIPFYFFVI